MDRIVIGRPDDFHVHLRDGVPLAAYAAESSRWFGRVLVMPNIKPAVTDAASLVAYRDRILSHSDGLEPLMTFQVTPDQDAAVLRALSAAGAIAGKYYPAGVTTNSEGGVTDWESCAEVFGLMERESLVLCVHGEMPGVAPWESEKAFLPDLERIIGAFPRLKIVMEHVSTAEAIELIARQDPSRVGATVTVHHLLFSAGELWSPRFSGHYYCKPLIQGSRDRGALQEWVLSGAPNVFFGSDSAPHPRESKEGAQVSPGIFSSPVALPLLADFFTARGEISLFDRFVARNGARFYGLPPVSGFLTLEKGGEAVPELIGGAVPLGAGSRVSWKPVPNSGEIS